ncbi:hypothetical protein AVEN_121081-1 [Araneus ventricosus]|uniref:C2H2-type domain-containing protein n=1 Tax=Araneus ventricosus TaxID=182803 RepID=A0A4Y2LU60_ARAVE|nr:hypothetical protein AVEN_121081-1 [Araneus ventricosus]
MSSKSLFTTNPHISVSPLVSFPSYNRTYPRDGSDSVELELQKSNLNERPILQDDRYNPSSAFDVSLLQYMSGDQSLDGSHPDTSPKGAYTYVAISDVDVVAQRRSEDTHFVCPMSGKSNRRRADFVVHYQTHTGEKPCLRYV